MFRVSWRVRVVSVTVFVTDFPVTSMNHDFRMFIPCNSYCIVNCAFLCWPNRGGAFITFAYYSPTTGPRNYVLVLAHASSPLSSASCAALSADKADRKGKKTYSSICFASARGYMLLIRILAATGFTSKVSASKATAFSRFFSSRILFPSRPPATSTDSNAAITR